MCLKCKKGGRKYVMLCKKSKTAERKGIACNFFGHPLKEILKPPLLHSMNGNLVLQCTINTQSIPGV